MIKNEADFEDQNEVKYPAENEHISPQSAIPNAVQMENQMIPSVDGLYEIKDSLQKEPSASKNEFVNEKESHSVHPPQKSTERTTAAMSDKEHLSETFPNFSAEIHACTESSSNDSNETSCTSVIVCSTVNVLTGQTDSTENESANAKVSRNMDFSEERSETPALALSNAEKLSKTFPVCSAEISTSFQTHNSTSASSKTSYTSDVFDPSVIHNSFQNENLNTVSASTENYSISESLPEELLSSDIYSAENDSKTSSAFSETPPNIFFPEGKQTHNSISASGEMSYIPAVSEPSVIHSSFQNEDLNIVSASTESCSISESLPKELPSSDLHSAESDFKTSSASSETPPNICFPKGKQIHNSISASGETSYTSAVSEPSVIHSSFQNEDLNTISASTESCSTSESLPEELLSSDLYSAESDSKTSSVFSETPPNVFFPKEKIYEKNFQAQETVGNSTELDANVQTLTSDERHHLVPINRRYIQKEGYRLGIKPGIFYSSTEGYFVEVTNGINYEVILTNETPVPCDVDIFIDNKPLPIICFRLTPGKPVMFEGPTFREKKLVFFRSKDAPSMSGINPPDTNNGIVRAVFTPQKIESIRSRAKSEPIPFSRNVNNALELLGIGPSTRNLRSYTSSSPGAAERGIDINNFCQGATALRGEKTPTAFKQVDPMETDETRRVVITLRLFSRKDDPGVPSEEDICSLIPPSIEELCKKLRPNLSQT